MYILFCIKHQNSKWLFIFPPHFRKESADNEKENPDPDDKKEEFYMSDDGKHTHGWVWLDKESHRWSLLSRGIVNRRTRIIFPADKLCT